jgi:hypothetical protein
MSTTKTELLNNLRTMLNDALLLRQRGGAYAKLARAHGYIDGYMRALMETGVANHAELLRVVSEERATVDGPAIRQVEGPESDAVEIAPRTAAA